MQSKSKELEYTLIKVWSNSIGYRQGCTVAAKEFAIATDGNVLPCRAMYYEAMNAGELKPYADENDCCRYKQESMLKMHIKLRHATNEI